MEEQATDQADGAGISLRIRDGNGFGVDEEEHGHENLQRIHQEALLECEALMNRRAAFSHVGADCVTVDVRRELQLVSHRKVFLDNR